MNIVVYFRAPPELVISRLSGPRAMPKLETLIDQSICVAVDDGLGIPVWSAVIPQAWEAKARTYTAKFLGVGMQEVWDDHQDVAKKILRKRVELNTGEVVEMSMDEIAPIGSSIVENGIPPHTFFGYNIETGLEEDSEVGS